MNSASVDLIYLDPPFNSNKNYAAPIGSEAAGAAFKDTWTLDDVDLAWHGQIAEQHPALYAIIDAAGLAHGSSMKSYLIMMAVRLLEMKRLLKSTGSIYLHCDPTASHYLKMTMDSIFGRENFRNEAIWSYRRWPSKQQNFQRMHDIVFRYAKSGTITWNQLYEEHSPSSQKMWKGKKRIDVTDEMTGRRHSITVNEPSPGVPMRDVWDISVIHPASKQRTGYPTQKPLKLLERIISASSNPGDMVLDPFCGCATACIAAEQLGRQWVGIDISPRAAELVKLRMKKELGLFYQGIVRTDIPQRTDLGKLPNYRSHKHTLFGQQEGRCRGCGTFFPFQNLTVDHVVPQSRGGSDHVDNLQLLCSFCNSTKGAGSQEELIAKLRQRGLITA